MPFLERFSASAHHVEVMRAELTADQLAITCMLDRRSAVAQVSLSHFSSSRSLNASSASAASICRGWSPVAV